MDASKITQLRQKQANIYINRAKVTDSSTLTWQKQIESSKYVASQAPVSDLPGCLTCSSTSTVANGTAGVGPGAILLGMEGDQPIYELTPPPSKPSLFARGMGSAGRVYTSTNIMYQLAGKNSCGVATPYEGNLIQTLPRCFCGDQDIFYQNGTSLYAPAGTDLSGNWLNPYLPIPQPYIQNTLPCTVCGLYKVNLNNRAGITYETATYVPSGPVFSTIQNGVVVYSTIAPKYDFIPNSNGVGGTQVQNGFTKPNAGDPRVLP